ncbi:CBM_collapsed_G0048680.mRNA.1.CDS.1 [Saccharomyces cerevisiae]|nr:CBM_collapsed_G0048680.mRNA.1.CDS.1 [Saccharomyces cerevisiae]
MSSSIFEMTIDHDGMDSTGLKLSQTASSISMGDEFLCSSTTSNSILDSPLPKVTFNHIDSITDINTNIMNEIVEPQSGVDVDVADKNVLYCIDPYPVEPPCYDFANPSKVIRYPIYEHCRPCLTSVKPPSYTPSVEHYTVVSMKMEKLSPFENASSRLWNNFILQINSTQINFYSIDDSLTRHIKNYRGGDMFDHSHHSKTASDRHHSARSLLNAFTTKSTYQFDKYDKERICGEIARDEHKFLSDERLFKSYSLQCAKVGLPIDYSSRDFVLRMRCEGQQFLVQFSHVDELIYWAMYLNMGISLSLDLELREMPTYRSVPRRRHPRARRFKQHNKNKNKNKSRQNSDRNDSRSHSLLLRRSHTSSVVTKVATGNERPTNKSRSRSLSLLPPSVSDASHDSNGPNDSGSLAGESSQTDVCGLFTSKLKKFL